ncbi:MAG: hypothetical protein PVF73_00670 [Bacteroidales bacterium]
MMNTRNLFFITGLFSALGIFSMSCEKMNSENEEAILSDLDVELASADAVADDIYEEIDATVGEKLMELNDNSYQVLSVKSGDDDYPCLQITVDYPDSTRFPKVITFDYGDGTMVFNSDHYQKGKDHCHPDREI